MIYLQPPACRRASARTNQTQEARVYSHDGPIRRGFNLDGRPAKRTMRRIRNTHGIQPKEYDGTRREHLLQARNGFNGTNALL
eukprot:5663748-Pyramimonas_sp.AAC.1